MDIDLSTDTAPSPERTIKLAEMIAEAVRVLNHQTRHHEALRYPSEADRLIRELSSAAGRLPQLLGQVGAWLKREDADGRIEVPYGEYQGNPLLAVAMARLRLDAASAAATALQEALDSAASVTCDLGAGGEGGRDE